MTSLAPHAQDHADHDDRTAGLLRAAARADDPERRRLLDQVVLGNLGIAESIARRYGGRGVDADELRQVAYLGLVAAARRFDPDRGHDFVSFAVPTILGEVKRYFRDHAWAVRPPRRIQELRAAMTSASDDLHQRLGSAPSAADLADHLGAPVEDVREAERSGDHYSALSIDQPAADADGATGTTLGDTLGGWDAGYDRSEATVLLTAACRSLPRRDAHIVYLRFFLGMTQQEIGAEIGVTQMQVSRLLHRILTQLRASIGELGAA
ncbi:sigma-70 family RNA polymerase sigma factor [Jiangella mangrovi]|uniref:RNA polymerase sigma-B factor n=1 Tax=Jiangella mangrovi TaxID=1524084 RepID=A0A7W9LM37_9ACTN|nr:sigma-70 family RNA polymerase sigma factor [Jiangella mangrovi]MBB5788860.1 RNA polymerase sigma-B factor [Jiangella mangrovi]